VQAAVWAIDPEDLGEAIEGEDSAEAQQRTVEGVEIVRGAVAVETEVHLGVDPEDSMDQAHAPAAAEVPRAWDLEVAVAVAAVVDGGGRHGRRT
jgi:hypothetical protein